MNKDFFYFGSLTQEKSQNLLIKLLNKNLFTQTTLPKNNFLSSSSFLFFFLFTLHHHLHPNVLVSNYIKIPKKILKILEMNYNDLEMLQFHFHCGNGG